MQRAVLASHTLNTPTERGGGRKREFEKAQGLSFDFQNNVKIEPLLPAVMKCKSLLSTPISEKSVFSGSSTTPSTACRPRQEAQQVQTLRVTAATFASHEEYKRFSGIIPRPTNKIRITVLPRRQVQSSWLSESQGPTLYKSYLDQNCTQGATQSHKQQLSNPQL